jgi:hypothetical protein
VAAQPEDRTGQIQAAAAAHQSLAYVFVRFLRRAL